MELGKVFISYAREDQKFALRLAEDLRKRGATVWIDTGIQGGEQWLRTLEAALEASDTLVLVVSPNSKKSDFVHKELLSAFEKQMHIIPVLYRRVRTWVLIAGLQYVDFTWYDEGIARLTGMPVPRRTIWRWILIILKVRGVQLLLILLALVAAGIIYRYQTSPSITKAALAAADKGAIVLRLENGGGKPSLLQADTLRMQFGSLPIEPEFLVPLEPAKTIAVPGHGHVDVRLRFANVLTPREACEGYLCTKEEVSPLISNATIQITGQVAESGGRTAPLKNAFSGSRVKDFIEAYYPRVPEP